MQSQKIVKIVNPVSISAETSVDMGQYLIVHNFEFDNNTKCFLNNQPISPKRAMSFAKYDNSYECRYYKTDKNLVKSSVYKNPDEEFYAVMIVGAIFIASVFIFFK